MFSEEIEQFFKVNLLYDCQVVNNKYFVGTMDVMYGKRMRGGYLFDELYCPFDVCCGTDRNLLEKVKTIYAKKVRMNMDENKEPSSGLRGMSLIKPIFNDPDYMAWLLNVAEEVGETTSEE